jgi:hypothetical protein
MHIDDLLEDRFKINLTITRENDNVGSQHGTVSPKFLVFP